MRRFTHGSQAPADCEVFGQDEARSPWFRIIGGIVFMLLGLAVMW
jgi:hypothetical protein